MKLWSERSLVFVDYLFVVVVVVFSNNLVITCVEYIPVILKHILNLNKRRLRVKSYV